MAEFLATIETLLADLIDPATMEMIKGIFDFIVEFLDKFALVG